MRAIKKEISPKERTHSRKTAKCIYSTSSPFGMTRCDIRASNPQTFPRQEPRACKVLQLLQMRLKRRCYRDSYFRKPRGRGVRTSLSSKRLLRVRGSLSSARIYLRLCAGSLSSSHAHARVRLSYHILQREARKQPDLWTDFRPNKHALRLRVPSASAEFTSDRMRNGPAETLPFARGSAPSNWRPSLSPRNREEGRRVREHRRSINRHWWAGEINLIPRAAGLLSVICLPCWFAYRRRLALIHFMLSTR